MAHSVDTSGVDLRTRTKQLGENVRRREWDMRFSIAKKTALSEELCEDRREEVVVDGLVLCESGDATLQAFSPTERVKLRKQMAATAGKEESFHCLSFWM